MRWHILTGEYPPQPGGVSAYTRQIARGLVEAGHDVAVWAPPADRPEPLDRGIVVHRLPDRFGWRSRRRLAREFDRPGAGQRILVQYVPHAFGWKGANMPFCAWLASRRHDAVWVMFHEVAYSFDLRQAPSRNALAAANRIMARSVARAAERIFVSIPGWQPMIDRFVDGEIPIEWLPVPSGIEVAHAPAAVAAVRARYADARPIVGHFGTHGASIRPLLAATIPPVMRASDCGVLLIGPRGDEVRRELVSRDPSLAPRLHATGPLPEAAVSHHIAACDVMVQPYPDGISSRRTSAMAVLAHGRPLVTTAGWLSEPFWHASDAIVVRPADDPAAVAAEAVRLVASADECRRLGARARQLYDERFDVRHTIAALTGATTLAGSASLVSR